MGDFWMSRMLSYGGYALVDEQRLSAMLTPRKSDYDFIMIDTPPAKAMLAFNGLAAADLIVYRLLPSE